MHNHEKDAHDVSMSLLPLLYYEVDNVVKVSLS